MFFLRRLVPIGAFLVLLGQFIHADFVVLYDGNGLPSNQSWLSYASIGGVATQSQLSSGVRLQTDEQVSAGYGSYLLLPTPQLKNPALPTLNRANGFELSFSLAVTSETHASDDRAGFSLTLLGSDARGIEIGFWTSQVWAQNTAFTRGEGVNIDTTGQNNYRLRIENDAYSLSNDSGLLLSGALRNYSGFGVPYSLPNMLFLGDNSTRGAADVTLGTITLQSNLASVPEPSSVMLLLSASAVLWLGIRARKIPSK